MTLGRREGLVAGSGLFVLVSGFLPWWVVRVDGVPAGFAGSAWRMSSRWSWAVALTVAASAVWLVWRLLRGRVPTAVWLVNLAAVTASVFLTLDQRADAEPPRPPAPSGTLAEEVRTSALVVEPPERDHLQSYGPSAVSADVSWGFWTGLAGMVFAGIALALSGTGDGRRRSAVRE